MRDRLNRIMSKHTGQPLPTIEQDTERDNFMGAEQCVEYGLVDRLLSERPSPE